MRLAKCAQNDGRSLLKKAILRWRQEARTQDRAERTLAEKQSALAELGVELPLRLRRETVGEQCVIFVDAVAQHRYAPRSRRPIKYLPALNSGFFRFVLANLIAMSAIFFTAHSK